MKLWQEIPHPSDGAPVREPVLPEPPVEEPAYPAVDPPAPPTAPPDLPGMPPAPSELPGTGEPPASAPGEPDLPSDEPQGEPSGGEPAENPTDGSPGAPVRVLSAAEEAEYREFLRIKRESEIALTLRRLVVDVSGISDRASLRAACGAASRLFAAGVLASPVQVSSVRRQLPREIFVAALVGGSGESLPSVKRCEAKRAVRQGADAVVLLPSMFSLLSGEGQNAKREWRLVRRAVKRARMLVALDDRRLEREAFAPAVRAAKACGADGVLVRGEPEWVRAAAEEGEGLLVEAGAENAEQLRLLLSAGAVRVLTSAADAIAAQLRQKAGSEQGGD